MFHLKSLVFVCCVGSLTSQTFFRTSLGGGGSYSSVSHGAHAGPAGQPTQQVYKVQPVKPAYQQPIYQQPTYQQPAYQKPVYQQPSYQQPSYKQPSYQQSIEKSPEVPTYGEKCTLSYEEKYVQVCVPELETACKPEKLKNGIRILEEYDCYSVTRTVCVEDEDIELTEVCAVAYSLQEVAAVAKILDVKWVERCEEEVICENPHSKGAYHEPAYCKEQIKKVCTLYPEVYPVEKKILMKLPQPYDTCITKEIILPRIRCQEEAAMPLQSITEKRCPAVPRAESADEVETEKCTVSLTNEKCQDTHVKLPKQACLETFRKTKVVYKEEENTGNYSVRY